MREMMIFPGVVKRREEITAAIDSVAPDVKKSEDDGMPISRAMADRSSSSFLLASSPSLCTDDGLPQKSLAVSEYA